MNQETKYTLTGILLALFLGALDQTIVATALPRIVEDLNGLSRYAWVATSYLVASTALVPIYGKLADMYSRKTIELVAVGFFLSGSFLCGLAGEFGALPLLGDGMSQLIIFRAVQGIGGAGLFAMAFIIIADLFPPAERGKYQGFVGAVFGIASVLGPWVGGLLTDHGGALIPGVAGWRWVFYVNVPFGALALWFIVRRMPPLLPQGEKQRLDYASALLLIGGLVPLVLALQLDKTAYPWGSWVTLSLSALGLMCLALFSYRSLHSANPILDFELFKNKVFRFANVALFFLGAAFFSIIIFLPLYMVNVVGVSATRAGVALIPLSMGLVTGSVVSGQLVSRFGHYRRWMLGGLALLSVGVMLLYLMTPDVSYWTVVAYMLVCGLGIGPSLPLYTLAIQNAVDVRRIGQATSASQFFRQIGGALGAALMGTLLASSLAQSFSEDMPLALQSTFQQSPDSQMKSSGGSQADKRIKQTYTRLYERIAQSVPNATLPDEVINSPLLDSTTRQRLQEGITTAQLPTLKEQLQQQAQQTIIKLQTTLKQAFNTAITRIYFFTLFIVAAGFVVTWFIPEIPLKKSNEVAEPTVAS
jgi:EmrB/QacA subfamily drug resistance transporter